MNSYLAMAQQGKSAQQVAQDTMLRNMKINQKNAQWEANKTGQPSYWNQGPMKGSTTGMGGVQNPFAATPSTTAPAPASAAAPAAAPNWGSWQKGDATVSEHKDLINSYYTQYLGRPAQGSEISDWVGTNQTPAQIEAGLRNHPTALKPLAIGGGGGGGGFGAASSSFPQLPQMQPQQFAPGGVGATVDNNAMGFRRKKSSARMAGLTTKGTNQFKIAGQSAKSSGLNIGI